MDLQKTGALIARMRKEKGLTQSELANLLHISHTTVSKWERGLGFPEVSLLEPLAAALGLTLADLFRGERVVQASLTEDLVNEAVRTAVEEVRKKHREARRNVFVLLFCLLLVLGLSVWAIVYEKTKPVDLDIRGTYQTVMIPVGDYGGQWDGGHCIQLAVQNWREEQWAELYIDSCLVDTGVWSKIKPNLYRIDGQYLDFDVELHRDGGFYFIIPATGETITMEKVSDVPMSSGNQEFFEEKRAEHRKLLTEE